MTTATAAGGPVPRIVAIGGGHGLSRTLQALRRVPADVTAVVTVADDGGSSGRLRRDLGVVPPGDLRMAIASMADDRGLAELLQYRFPAGELEGHALGNLVLVAMEDLVGGDLVAALDRVCSILQVPGRVLPCTTKPVTLHARTAGGPVAGQVAVATSRHVEDVWLEPVDPEATPEAVSAIEDADLVVLGPGSLFTSILPNLLVPGIGSAVSTAAAPVLLVANLREQPGETEGMHLDEHLAALERHVPGIDVDLVLCHDGKPPTGPGRTHDPASLDGVADVEVTTADLIDGQDGHDPDKLATAIRRVVGRQARPAAANGTS